MRRTHTFIALAVIILLVPISSVAASYYYRSALTSPGASSATVARLGSYPVSADQASAIAVASSPGATMTGAPMLVSVADAAVYEVTLDTGMVYVDATSGHVLSNVAINAAPATTNATPATTNSGQDGEGSEGSEDSK
jgi:hypothetical protein